MAPVRPRFRRGIHSTTHLETIRRKRVMVISVLSKVFYIFKHLPHKSSNVQFEILDSSGLIAIVESEDEARKHCIKFKADELSKYSIGNKNDLSQTKVTQKQQ